MPEISSSKWLTTASWDDVPHLTKQAKRELLASTPTYLRRAWSEGVPSLGADAIYPVPPEEVWAEPFKIPHHYKRCYALDAGWNRTAALWMA